MPTRTNGGGVWRLDEATYYDREGFWPRSRLKISSVDGNSIILNENFEDTQEFSVLTSSDNITFSQASYSFANNTLIVNGPNGIFYAKIAIKNGNEIGKYSATLQLELNLIQGGLIGQFSSGDPGNSTSSGNFISVPLTNPIVYSSINYSNRGDYYGFMAIGYFKPPVDGAYTFYTSSDDGSGVWIGDIAKALTGRSASNLLVNNNVNGYQGNTERSGSITLVGDNFYAIRIVHHEGSSGDNLRFSWSGGGVSKTTSLISYFHYSPMYDFPI